MMWETFRDRIVEKNGEVRMEQRVKKIHRDDRAIRAVEVENVADGSTYVFSADQFISSMPITALVENMVPPAPLPVREAASKLKYRDFLIVTLILKKKDLFPDNWIYIHSPEVKVGRIQNFRSWSPELLPDDEHSSIGMEYFCNEGDQLWEMDNAELLKLAEEELRKLDLVGNAEVVDGSVIRQPKAYPVYDHEYGDALRVLREWLDNFPNLQAVGRNGMHRYNNQDHSMLTAMLAVKNILGESHDLWSVNVEQEYHEETDENDSAPKYGERLQPERVLAKAS
jgi:protoporphyrinogen oxidase